MYLLFLRLHFFYDESDIRKKNYWNEIGWKIFQRRIQTYGMYKRKYHYFFKKREIYICVDLEKNSKFVYVTNKTLRNYISTYKISCWYSGCWCLGCCNFKLK